MKKKYILFLILLLTVKDGSAFTFCVYGDSRSYPEMHAMICNAINLENPELVIHAGDLWDGYGPREWKAHITSQSNLNELLLNNRYLVAKGNHETSAEIFSFSPSIVRGSTTQYSFSEGNSFFVCTGEVPDAAYLAAQLQTAAAQKAVWRFAYFHYPIYSTGKHGAEGKADFEAVCDQYGVTMAFSAHDHMYERTFLIYNGKVAGKGSGILSGKDSHSTAIIYPAEKGTVYIVTGGGGAPLYRSGYDWWTACSESSYHYLIINVRDKYLTLKAKTPEGTVIDELTILKEMVHAE